MGNETAAGHIHSMMKRNAAEAAQQKSTAITDVVIATAELPALLTQEQVADYLGVSPRTMEAWRLSNKGPRWRKLAGNSVRYLVQDVVNWIDSPTPGADRGTSA